MSANNPEADEEIVSTTYFEKIPLWSSDVNSSRFEVMADEISGRIPVTRLESWRDFTHLLEDSFFNRIGVQLAFRGHRRFDWSLMPTLGRLPTSGIVSEELAQDQLAFFKRAVRGRIPDPSLVDDAEEDELWSVGQHHGLMTPLLDWTYSPYVALFFAFAKPDSDTEDDNPYRSIYVINKSFVDDGGICPDIRVLEPRKDNHGRLVNQAGLFTFSPTDATIENKLTDVLTGENTGDEELKNADEKTQPEILAKYICKIYIKNEEREACIRHLRRMNVHHASLFPDLIGASEYCNILISEDYIRQLEERRRRENEMKAAAKEAEASKETEEHTIETPPEISGEGVEAIAAILKTPGDAQQVEPGRLDLIAEKLEAALSKHLVVDWKDRESALAKLRNIGRVTLRRFGYPPNLRDDVLEQILDHLKAGEAAMTAPAKKAAKKLPKKKTPSRKASKKTPKKKGVKQASKKAPKKRK